MLVDRKEARAGRSAATSPGEVWWLISRRKEGRMEAMTLSWEGRDAVAVFSHEEEAALFLWSMDTWGVEDGWRVQERRCGELVSVLCGPCAGAAAVALDPLPQMVDLGTAPLVYLDRDSFLERLLSQAVNCRSTMEQLCS